MWKKRKPKRLYYPVKSNWTRRQRQRPQQSVRRRPLGRSIKKIIQQWIMILLIIAVGAGILFLAGLSSSLSVKTIQINRDSFFVETSQVEAVLNDWKGESILFISKGDIRQAILDEFEEFERVTVQKKLPDTLVINVFSHPIMANIKLYYTLPEEEALLEQESDALKQAISELDLEEKTQQDASSIALPFNQADLKNAFTIEEEPPEVFEQKGLLNAVGQVIFDQEENLELITVTINGLTQPATDRETVIDPGHMQFWQSAQDYFENTLSQQVTSVNYLPTAREIHFILANGSVIWLSTERDYKAQIDKLKTIYQTDVFEEGEVSYIDLRVQEKVIYCLKNTVCAR